MMKARDIMKWAEAVKDGDPTYRYRTVACSLE
jgi:hypothetical protein